MFTSCISPAALGQASDLMREVVDSVKSHGGKGEIVLKLSVRRMGPEGSRKIIIEEEVGYKKPKKPTDPRVFFSDDENHLYRNDPDQMDLNLEVVKDGSDEPVEQVDNQTKAMQ